MKSRLKPLIQQCLNLFQTAATPPRPGQHFELVAANWLQARGLQLIERNYHCRGGELDLIMRQGDTLVFVEVRYRADNDHGGAAASVTPAKQRKLMLAARHYLTHHGINEASQACRFDVLAFEGNQPDWIQNAF